MNTPWERRVFQAIQALSKERDLMRASWSDVRTVLIEAASFIVEESKQKNPPIRLGKMLESRKIHTVLQMPGHVATEAILTPDENGFHVSVAQRSTRARKRFDIAHEFGHTFFFDLNKIPPTRMVSKQSLSIINQKEEEICSAFARELLMPRDMVIHELEKTKSVDHLNWIYYLASTFEVSTEVVLRRLLWDLNLLIRTVAILKETNFQSSFYSSATRVQVLRGLAVKRLYGMKKKCYDQAIAEIRKEPDMGILVDYSHIFREYAFMQWRKRRFGDATQILLLLNY